jgi:hypothetical protein
MRSTTTVSLAILGFAVLFASAVRADGEVCSASEMKTSNGLLRKAETAEKSGKIRDAYAIATQGIPSLHCAENGYKRRDGLIERTSKKLGAEAEKGGRFGEAFDYYSAPHRHGRLDYPLADADRTMLKYAKANSDNYKVVSQAMGYFDQRDGRPHLNDVRALAKSSGDKMLAKEEKTFAVRRGSLDDLHKAREWLNLAGDSKPARARAEQRGNALLAEDTARSIELAMEYYRFADNRNKEKQAQERARKLGDEHARNGEHRLAVKFYELAGDDAKARALAQKTEAESKKVEAKRQDQFKKDQQALEKELGL